MLGEGVALATQVFADEELGRLRGFRCQRSRVIPIAGSTTELDKGESLHALKRDLLYAQEGDLLGSIDVDIEGEPAQLGPTGYRPSRVRDGCSDPVWCGPAPGVCSGRRGTLLGPVPPRS